MQWPQVLQVTVVAVVLVTGGPPGASWRGQVMELRHIQGHLPAPVLVKVCQWCAVWAGPPVRVVAAAEPCQAVCLRQLRLRAGHEACLVALTGGTAVADGAPGLPAAWLQVLHSSCEDGPARLVLRHVLVAVVWA